MVRGRKPKCFGYFTNDEEVWKRFGVDPSKIDVGYRDAGFYCMTNCTHSMECAIKSEKCEANVK